MAREKLYKKTAALLLAAAMLLASCSGGARAASMRLVKTEGDVAVADDAGKDVALIDNLGLYGGYGVETREESFAWINLDDVKLTKLDQESEIEIEKEGKALTIEVKSGSLFFNITQPLEDGETLDICCSTMMVGIRGTCGWVEVIDKRHMDVYLLEGEARCAVDDEDETVSAGEMARLSREKDEQPIQVKEFNPGSIPAFVQEELDGDAELRRRVEDGSDLLDRASLPTRLLEGIAYYGDPSACAMTPAQAEAYAQLIRNHMAQMETNRKNINADWFRSWTGEDLDSRPNVATAALFDLGGGVPALLFGGGVPNRVDGDSYSWLVNSIRGLWLYGEDGVVAQFTESDKQALYDGYLLIGGMYEEDAIYSYKVLEIADGKISSQPSMTAKVELDRDTPDMFDHMYLLDGQRVSLEEFDAWMQQWVGGVYDPAGKSWNGDTSLAGFADSTDIVSSSWGMSPAEDVLAVLDAWAETR